MIALLITAMASCSNDGDGVKIPDGRGEADGENPGIEYFKSIYLTDEWIACDVPERLAMLNLPEEILNELTTDQLTECCAKQRMFGYAYFYNDMLKYVVQQQIPGFNGFSALKERPDYAKSLIDAYEDLSLGALNGEMENYEFRTDAISKSIRLSYMYAVFYTEYFPEVLKGENGMRLREIVVNGPEFSRYITHSIEPIDLVALIDSYNN